MLHVGLMDSASHSFTPTTLKSTDEEINAIRKKGDSSQDMLYLQWCKLTMSEKDRSATTMSEEIAFSSKCETVYVGALLNLD